MPIRHFLFPDHFAFAVYLLQSIVTKQIDDGHQMPLRASLNCIESDIYGLHDYFEAL